MHGSFPIYIIWGVAVCALIFLRLRVASRARRLRLGTLWIVPAIFAAATGFLLYEVPLHGLQLLYGAVALTVGGIVGWRRGMMMRINVDPETRTLNQQASPAAILFVIAILLARRAFAYEAGSMGFNVALVTDLLMLFVLGMFSVARLEMFLRARRMLREHLATTFS